MLVVFLTLVLLGQLPSELDSFRMDRTLRSNLRTLSATRTISMNKGDNHFDYLIIGGGSGGVASSRRAAVM